MSWCTRAAASVILGIVVTLFVTAGAIADPWRQVIRAQADCPYRETPPPAIDASEQPLPGQQVPSPLPQPRTEVGGTRMAECGMVLPTGAGQPPAAEFESWVLADLNTGAVLAARDPHARQRPASLIKVLLALVVLRDLKLETVVTGTQDDANQEGTRAGIGPGGLYSNDQLLHALLMCSGNDAAHALAMQLGGMQATVDKMNALAAELGAMDTRTATPSGLDGPGMSSSAYDLAVFFRAGMRDSRFASAVATRQMDFPGYGGRPGFALANDNVLLTKYSGDIGGKTGYTDDARHTYVTAAQRGDSRIVFVGMRGTMSPVGAMYTQTAPMLDYGFALEGAKAQAVGQLVDQGSVAPPTPPTSPAIATARPTNTDSGSMGFSDLLVILLILLALGIVLFIGYRRRQVS